MVVNDETRDYLAARQYGYLLFQRVMGSPPDAAVLAAIDCDIAEEAMGIVMGVGGGAAASFMDSLRKAKDDAESLRSDYTRLFEGPAALPAPLWESVYVSNKRVIMQPSTLEVRNLYRQHGLLPERYPHVPDDHIAIELDFLRALAGRACEAADSGDGSALALNMRASREFLGGHLGKWAGRFAEAMREKGRSEFYALAAGALSEFLAADAAKLERLAGELED